MNNKIKQVIEQLTELELEVLTNGVLNNDYTDGPEGATWVWAVWECSSIDKSKVSRKQLSGVISSLCKKGIITSDGAKYSERGLWYDYKKSEILSVVYFHREIISAWMEDREINEEHNGWQRDFAMEHYPSQWLGSLDKFVAEKKEEVKEEVAVKTGGHLLAALSSDKWVSICKPTKVRTDKVSRTRDRSEVSCKACLRTINGKYLEDAYERLVKF